MSFTINLSCISAPLTYYVSESEGDDTKGNGSKKFPYKSVRRAFEECGDEIPGDIQLYVDGKDDARWMIIPSTRFKKQLKNYKLFLNKKKSQAAAELATAAASAIQIKEDESLPAADVHKIRALKEQVGKRVKVFGWAHRVRRQSKKMMFIILRDGTGFLQCVLTGNLPQCADGITLSTESSLFVKGVISKVPEGQAAPGGIELQADYFEVIGKAPAGGTEAVVTEDSEVDWQLDQRHLMIRGMNTSKIVKLTAVIAESFREHYIARGFTEVSRNRLSQIIIDPTPLNQLWFSLFLCGFVVTKLEFLS